MKIFENVSVEKGANIYFDGKVTSRTILFQNGEKKTLGIMLQGEYEFKTAHKELMEITKGNVQVQLPDNDEWVTYEDGQEFEVPANSSFKVAVIETTDYCCSYIQE